MLDYTSALLEKTWNDIKRFFYAWNFGTQLLYILYLLYALIFKTGFWFINAPMLFVCTAYFIFFLYCTRNKTKKILEQRVKTLYKRCKLLINAFSLAIAIYGIYFATIEVNPFSAILTSFMLIGWILGVVFQIIEHIVEKYKALFKEAFKADTEFISKPSNFIKKLVGKEVEEKQEPTKQRIFLDKVVAERKAKKQKEKEKKKQRLASEKAAKKQAKKLAKEDDCAVSVAVIGENTEE